MINLDKILGAFVQSAMIGTLSSVLPKRAARGVGVGARHALSRIDKKALGAGVLGLAIAAYEHFTKETGSARSSALSTRGSKPPPPPSKSVVGEVRKSAADSTGAGELKGSPEALLLLRTMVAAASADGVIDPDERSAILGALDGAGLLDTAEKAFLEREFSAPHSLEDIVAQVTSPELAEQVYAVAMLAITVDNDEERVFLERFKRLLQLPDATI